MGRRIAVLAAVLVAGSTAAWPLNADRVGTGFAAPVFATAPTGDADRLFVVELAGEIRILDLNTHTIANTPFLTVPNLAVGGEQGLLGMAFHPDYATNGYFFVYCTNTRGNTELRRYRVTSDPNVADPSSGTLLIEISQPFGNHNGGWIGFGPDGYLYIASGDGGAANDPHRNAQNKRSFLGKILRIDVDHTTRRKNYAIPATNPFRGKSSEIWAYGLRNPWRCSFDRETGDFWIADVGQDAREEINFEQAGARGGTNYGWRAREGTLDNPSVRDRAPRNATDPIYDYAHGFGAFEGYSITGGCVYRGDLIPLTQGAYFFADFVSNQIWSLRYENGTLSELTDRTAELAPAEGSLTGITSFGEGGTGELFIVCLGGDIFQIVP